MSKPSDLIKIETLLASLGLEYESTLAILEVSDTIEFESVVSKLKKAKVRLKGQGMTTEGQNLAHYTFTRNINSYDSLCTKKGVYFYCSKLGYFKHECKKLLIE